VSELVGIRLDGGPFAGHNNAYPWEWPPPEEIVAFTMHGQVAVADAVHEAQAREVASDVTRYVKTGQSSLGADHPAVILRGAIYAPFVFGGAAT
jgi:hypothetical protein